MGGKGGGLPFYFYFTFWTFLYGHFSGVPRLSVRGERERRTVRRMANRLTDANTLGFPVEEIFRPFCCFFVILRYLLRDVSVEGFVCERA